MRTHRQNSVFRSIYQEIANENLYLKKYLMECVKSFNRAEAEFEQKLDENSHLLNTSISNGSDIYKALELMENEYFSRKLYPSFILSNLILSVYSIFEISLLRLLEIIDESAKPVEKFTPKSGDLLNKVLKHVKEHSNFDMSSAGKHWITVCNLSLIRNCLVHYNGDFRLFENHNPPHKVNHLRSLVNKDSSLVFTDKNKIAVTSEEIVHRFALSCQKLIHETVKACEEEFEAYSYDLIINFEEKKVIKRVRVV